MEINDLYDVSNRGLKPFFLVPRGQLCQIFTGVTDRTYMESSIYILKAESGRGTLCGAEQETWVSIDAKTLVREL